MREALLILLVVVVLLALTAIRYRKQIAGMIALGRMVKQAKRSAAAGARTIPEGDGNSIALVNCSKCDVWVPQGKTVKFRDGFVCAEACLKAVPQKN